MPETTVGQRVSRAKTTLRRSGAAFGQVTTADLPRRLHSVRHVLHQVFTAGSTLVEGEDLIDSALTDEAIRLAERLRRALPRDGETVGLLG